MRPLVWFRSDLRVEDNPALHRACAAADRGVAAVFLACPGQWREHDWAAAKVDLVARTLAELSADLARLRVPLLVRSAGRFRDAPAALLDVARRLECDAIYFNREYEVNETARDDEVVRAFESDRRTAVPCHDQCVVPPGTLRTGAGAPYTVFTPFRRAWLAHVRDRGLPRPLGRPRRQPQPVARPDDVAAAFAGFEAPRGAERWPAGARKARRRLQAFIGERLRGYARQRDLPGLDATSRLSPYLSCGAISARQCVAAACEANGGRLNGRPSGAATWISEIVWREFYRHFMVGFPRVSRGRPFRSWTDRVTWRDDAGHFEAWCAGRTGVPIVDAAMRQLAHTGWMHNRARMITAMFLTKDLLIDWRRGERHFMRQLVDGDLASNNGGWQWSASTGADAAPYFRVFNPWLQGRRFDPQGRYIRQWVPELAGVPDGALHDPRARRLDYPEPLVEHTAAAARAVAAFRSVRPGAR